MIYDQAVKSVWSTLHKELLQMAGYKQWETEHSRMHLEQ